MVALKASVSTVYLVGTEYSMPGRSRTDIFVENTPKICKFCSWWIRAAPCVIGTLGIFDISGISRSYTKINQCSLGLYGWFLRIYNLFNKFSRTATVRPTARARRRAEPRREARRPRMRMKRECDCSRSVRERSRDCCRSIWRGNVSILLISEM